MVGPYKCCQSEGHVKQNLTEHAYCLLTGTCRVNSTLNFCLGHATMTLHQGHCHRNEYSYIYKYILLELQGIEKLKGP